jgi:hypothetical protein
MRNSSLYLVLTESIQKGNGVAYLQMNNISEGFMKPPWNFNLAGRAVHVAPQAFCSTALGQRGPARGHV